MLYSTGRSPRSHTILSLFKMGVSFSTSSNKLIFFEAVIALIFYLEVETITSCSFSNSSYKGVLKFSFPVMPTLG